jgi:anaphase-promoting complex subunit 1
MGPNAAELTLWPEFHNGVAAGLRVYANTYIRFFIDHTYRIVQVIPEKSSITRNWILYNKPSACNTAHSGLLLALGLQV